MLFTETAIRQALKRADEQPEDCLHDTPINIKMILAERNQYYQRVARLSHTVNQLRDSLGKFKAGFFLTITSLPIGTFLLGLYFDKFVDFFAR